MRRTAKKNEIDKELDALVRERVYERDGFRCVRCGRTANLTPSHILPRGRYKRLQWEEYNILTMCWLPCHGGWWHKNPMEAHAWLEEKYPGRYQRLREMAACAPKVDKKLLLTVLRAEASHA